MTDFERKLQRQPIRELPSSWRREILPAAEATPAGSTWRDWFWPAPEAWDALAAIWLILALMTGVGREQPREQPGANEDWTARVPLTSLVAHRHDATGEFPN